MAKLRDGDETMIKAWEMRQPPYSLPQIEIAKRLGITQAGVCKALARARKLYGTRIDKGKEKIRQDIEETVERLDYLFSEAIQAWERSKKSVREVSIKKNVPVIIGGKEVYERDEENNEEMDEDGGQRSQKIGLKMTAQGLKTVAYFDEVRVTKIHRDGNHNFLFSAMSAIREISEIKGIKAPTKTALTNPEGDKEAGTGDSTMIDKELANRLLSMLSKAKKRREADKHG